MLDNTKPQAGFTIPELVVTLSVFGILSVAMMTAIVNYYSTIVRNNIAINMTVTSQNFLRTTVERIRYSSGVSSTNSLSNTAQGGTTTAGFWNTGNTNFVIVIQVPAIDQVTSEQIVSSATGDTYLNELVYYRESNNLKLQTLAANTGADGTNSLSSTCSVAQPGCPGDKIILEDLDTISFVFYDKNIDVTPTPDEAKSIYITLTTSRDSFFDPVELTNSIRVTLRNNE